MLTDPLEILQEIIEQDGDCESWAGPAICKRCPLGNKRIDGRRLSCVDYIKQRYGLDSQAENLSAIYKTAAEEELFATEFENLLE